MPFQLDRTVDRARNPGCLACMATLICVIPPWAERLNQPKAKIRLRPNRGAHIVSAKRLPADSAMAIPLAEGRLLFAIPWQGRVILGTTESQFDGDLDCVAAQDEEVDFLLELARRFFPKAETGRNDILASFGRGLARSSSYRRIDTRLDGLYRPERQPRLGRR